MNVNGKIIVIGETETIGLKGFQKRLVVVQTDEQYPQTIPVEFTQDKTTLLNNFNINDFVEIGINLRGTEWKGRYFANINGWKISKADSSLTAAQQMPNRESVQPINNALPQDDDSDGLPF
jgi:hypothetical protein